MIAATRVKHSLSHCSAGLQQYDPSGSWLVLLERVMMLPEAISTYLSPTSNIIYNTALLLPRRKAPSPRPLQLFSFALPPTLCSTLRRYVYIINFCTRGIIVVTPDSQKGLCCNKGAQMLSIPKHLPQLPPKSCHLPRMGAQSPRVQLDLCRCTKCKNHTLVEAHMSTTSGDPTPPCAVISM
ncbi:hypothetical protein AC579_10464 [Pseudocercospora musae]|uniref:Uncharacterized protein n=1 Tax=Pseudocercospora musae TaxID=113226 RepID=A0A139IE05_9PEZI|nr:hypothetical protein AC579_10464 [Pseudocercospora musae]